jgi:hypothetical protein
MAAGVGSAGTEAEQAVDGLQSSACIKTIPWAHRLQPDESSIEVW